MEDEDSSCFFQDKDALFNQIDEDLDLAIALSLQQELNRDSQPANKQVDSPSTSKSNSKPLSIIDAQWELIDPNPDIRALFLEFNTKFFYGQLDAVEVRWSPRMTLCAGLCCYEGRGKLCSVRLSVPLLKLRPRKDLIETLLHEMIHAYLFVTENNKDHDAHGSEFLKHMDRINKEAGTKISVYHSFHDEVDSYRTHWWKCNGPCKEKWPYFGVVKRATNRAPGPSSSWWAEHQSTCGGTFTKIKEPDNYKQKSSKRKFQETKDQKGIKSYFGASTSKSNGSSFTNSTKKYKDETNAIQSSLAKEANIVSNTSSLTNSTKKYNGDETSAIQSFFPKEANIVSNTSSLTNSTKKYKGVETSAIQSFFAKEANIVSMNSGSSLTRNLPPLREMNPPVPFTGQGFTLGSSSSEGPISLLAKLRKDGLLNAKTSPSISSFEKTQNAHSNNNEDEFIKKLDIDKKESTNLQDNFSNVTLSVLEKNKLVQSTSDQFVSSPTRNSEATDTLPLTYISQQRESSKVECPVCSNLLPNADINSHLDQCLLTTDVSSIYVNK